jgi:hypothetical protein
MVCHRCGPHIIANGNDGTGQQVTIHDLISKSNKKHSFLATLCWFKIQAAEEKARLQQLRAVPSNHIPYYADHKYLKEKLEE